MRDCKNCRKDIGDGCLYECPSCGAVMCEDCSTELKNICPYCYSSLELKG